MTTLSFDTRATTVETQASATRVLLRLSPAPESELLVQVGHSGTAAYGTDWSLPRVVSVPAGKASWSVSVGLRPSFIAPETAVLKLLTGQGYTVVADKATHTITRVIGKPVGDKPDGTNTGPKAGAPLKKMNGMTITKPGTVLRDVEINGSLVVRAPNFTLQNFRINGGGTYYGVEANTYDAPGLILEDGEIVNCASCAVYGIGITARRLNVHEQGGDAFKLHGDGVMEACWIHHLGMNPGAHADADQSLTGVGLRIVGNNMDVPQGVHGYESNSSLSISGFYHAAADVLIENNWLGGGTYSVYLTSDKYGLHNCKMINNRFYRNSQYGPLYMDDAADVVISGNVWDDDDSLMEINNA